MNDGSTAVVKGARPRWWRTAKLSIPLTLVIVGLCIAVLGRQDTLQQPGARGAAEVLPLFTEQALVLSVNPLEGRQFYRDSDRAVDRLAQSYRDAGNAGLAQLAEKVSSQPSTIWLNGPRGADTTAQADVDTVVRTSRQAAATGTVVVYQLYAIPNRDACADYSRGGFSSYDSYLSWLDRLIASLEGDAVFTIETDSIAQTIRSNCLTDFQTAARYAFLKDVVTRLTASPRVLATYLDAGHPEWFPDPSVLVEPLKQSGIDSARGFSVNVSNFVATDVVTNWSQQLVRLLGGDKGVMIDTSRNGAGAPPQSVTGDARWCNPSGRALGHPPTSAVADTHIDAYFWIKVVGDSDGDCFGYPPAGTFMPDMVIELAGRSPF